MLDSWEEARRPRLQKLQVRVEGGSAAAGEASGGQHIPDREKGSRMYHKSNRKPLQGFK